MHIHATQPNPYAALDALRSAQKTEANREAERVRKRLMESASELEGESELSDACVVQVASKQESQGQSKRRGQRHDKNNDQKQPSPEDPVDPEEDDSHLSDWA
jgi:hypothetical protein